MDDPIDADDVSALNHDSHAIWQRKAAFWDARMGDGNAFHTQLVGPTVERLLAARPGDHVLDIACGNGQFARRMAKLGASVLATDFSSRMLELARARSGELQQQIDYREVDATDEAQLLALGEHSFDAAVCNMALMDMPTLTPLAHALPRLLKADGRFVFAVMHPAFNSPATRMVLEEDDRAGTLESVRAVKVVDYLDVAPRKGAGMPDEPEPHWYFHRSLSELLRPFFAAGLLLDDLAEPAFSAGATSNRPLSWAHFRQIPPVLVARLRLRSRTL